MKTTSITTSTLKHLAVAALLGLGLLVHASDKSAAVAKPAPVVIPKSIFTDDPQLGKDPFFPNSTRRVVVASRVVATNVGPATATFDPFRLLTLKGISGTTALPLAIINGTTVAQGETAEIRVGPQIIKIRCLSVRESSVLLELDGSKEIKELRLREGF